MKKIVITILCLLLLPMFVWGADDFLTNGDVTVNITVGGVDVALTVQSSGTADTMVVNSGNVQITLSANSSVTVTNSDRRILTNTLSIGTTCESNQSKLILPAQTTATTVTITPSTVDYCGGGGSGVAQISTPSTGGSSVSTPSTETTTATETTIDTTTDTVDTTDTTTTEQATAVEITQDGDLIRAEGDEKVYLIQDGKRKHIASAEAFNAAGYDWSDVKVVASSITNSYSDYFSGTLYKTADAEEVYLVVNNRKRHIPSIEAFNAYGFSWSDIAIIPDNGLEVYETDSLYRASGDTKVYKITNGKKAWIKTAAEFNAAGYDWNKIIEVNQIELNAYPDSASVGETIAIKASALRVRSSADLSGEILDAVYAGETYEVLEENNGWYKITISNGVTGWCYGGDTGGYASKQ